MRKGILSLVAVAVMVAPAAASADDYCVGSPAGCTGTDEMTDLQKGLDDAKAHAGADRVLIGPGTYTRVDGFSYIDGLSANTVEVRGVGSPAPTVTMTTSSFLQFALTLNQNGSAVSDLTIDVPLTATPEDAGGLLIASGVVADNLTVNGPTLPIDQNTGVQMGGGTLSNSTVTMSSVQGIGIYLVTNSGGTIRDSTIVGARALDLAPGASTATVRRDRISAGYNGLYIYSGNVLVDNSLIDLQGGSGAYGIVQQTTPTGLTGTVQASELTIRNGGSGSAGIEQHSNNNNANLTVDLSDSIIRGVVSPILQETPTSGSTYTVNATDDDYDQSANLPAVLVPGQARNETGIINVDPHFLAPILGAGGLSGDYRLAADSPVIDTGSSTPLGSGETDLAGQPRIVDGVAPFAGAVRDLGAYEYQLPQEQPPLTSGIPSAAPPTGLRAAALKKCKKKKTAAKRRKCRRRARQLPV